MKNAENNTCVFGNPSEKHINTMIEMLDLPNNKYHILPNVTYDRFPIQSIKLERVMKDYGTLGLNQIHALLNDTQVTTWTYQIGFLDSEKVDYVERTSKPYIRHPETGLILDGVPSEKWIGYIDSFDLTIDLSANDSKFDNPFIYNILLQIPLAKELGPIGALLHEGIPNADVLHHIRVVDEEANQSRAYMIFPVERSESDHLQKFHIKFRVADRWSL